MNEQAFERVQETISKYQKLIQIIEKYQNDDNVCRLSKKKISEELGLSYTGTLNKLKFLKQYELIEEEQGGLKLSEKSLMESPLGLLLKIMMLVLEKPEVYSSFKQQAELLDVPIKDIQSAWGFAGYFFGSKYKGTTE